MIADFGVGRIFARWIQAARFFALAATTEALDAMSPNPHKTNVL